MVLVTASVAGTYGGNAAVQRLDLFNRENISCTIVS